MRELRTMDAAEQLIVRYALNQRREHLPKELAALLDNPTRSAQDLIDVLHEKVDGNPELSRHFIQLLTHHPHSTNLGGAPGLGRPGNKPGGVFNGAVAEGEKFHLQAVKALNLKREALVARVDEDFFPERDVEERIDLDVYVKLMQALEFAKSLRALNGIERELDHRLKCQIPEALPENRA